MVRPLLWQAARVVDNIRETARAARLHLDVPEWSGHLPGQHVDVRLTAEDGYSTERSYSIASPPERDGLELIVERLEDGEVSPYLTDELRAGDELELRGPIGGYFVWHRELGGPVQLIAGGSGVVPFLAMLGHRAAALPPRVGAGVGGGAGDGGGAEDGDGGGAGAAAMRLLYSARAADDLLAGGELEAARGSGAVVSVTLTRSAPPGWTGLTGRVDGALLRRCVWPPADAPMVFVCGPTAFVEVVANHLVEAGHDPGRVKTERFGATG